VIADDVSQNALSTFIGAFIFSIVALTTLKNEYFGTAGLFILFTLTAAVFGAVIVTFVHWVDRIARLGRLGSTIDKVEQAAAAALARRRNAPTLSGVPTQSPARGRPVFADRVGYVQHIDIASLQAWAAAHGARVVIAALPGVFATRDRALAYVNDASGSQRPPDSGPVADSFEIGHDRRFDDDPRFGLVVLSEVASRALSPAVNDPGTAIGIIGSFVRLFDVWGQPPAVAAEPNSTCDRIEVPAISVRDMFDDAFTSIARDGATMVEVSLRLQKALRSLAVNGDSELRDAARHHARLALARARHGLTLPEDLEAVSDAATWVESNASTSGVS
jgi:uncharacterized membrane protein